MFPLRIVMSVVGIHTFVLKTNFHFRPGVANENRKQLENLK